MSLFCRGARFIGYLNAEPKKGDVGWSSRMLSKFGHYNSLQTSDTINISFSDLTWPPDRTDTNTFYSKTSLSIRALSTLFPVRYLPTYGSKALVKWKFPSIGVKSLKNQASSALYWRPKGMQIRHKISTSHLGSIVPECSVS